MTTNTMAPPTPTPTNISRYAQGADTKKRIEAGVGDALKPKQLGNITKTPAQIPTVNTGYNDMKGDAATISNKYMAKNTDVLTQRQKDDAAYDARRGLGRTAIK